ncbi:MAG TPA: hypothetical protein VM282_20975 [Acidimicrobiales bacterium]|nr:hypothetical protein [Acidimicrobiales bacterium]
MATSGQNPMAADTRPCVEEDPSHLVEIGTYRSPTGTASRGAKA